MEGERHRKLERARKILERLTEGKDEATEELKDTKE